MRVLDPDQTYTFSKIFELNAEVDDVVADFGYSLSRQQLELPKYSGELDRLVEVRRRISEVLPYVNLRTEAARREILVAPIVTDLVHYTGAQLRIEYPLKVSSCLQGYLDYLLRTDKTLLVIEAKKEDMNNGFTQLAVELIALDQWFTTSEEPTLLGAVTTGNIWQFGVLHRETQNITQDVNLYVVPDDLEPVLRISIRALRL
ncbi:MAG: hypothetical protein HC838_07660 [Spirulinaceae cyanobacterium RM2_2_10]|nr:hypothetical protein [Spirulinaceae cyanobacterium SM2_1_0]NJO19954.1 hypothetical protein [Spirulinaceae cyanobacterium RM2_2_10]